MKSKFDHEKLEVYQLELQFISWVTPLIQEARENAGSIARETCDHLDRASLSILFNTAEGNGKRQMRVRARFFDDARGSSAECAACLDALMVKGVCDPERVVEGKNLLHSIYSILSRLVSKFSVESRVAEEVPEYAAVVGWGEG